MSIKILLATALALGLLGGGAFAQPVNGGAARDPLRGDTGNRTMPPHKRENRAAAIAKADKQPPGTENGNQPDRASAGGGGR